MWKVIFILSLLPTTFLGAFIFVSIVMLLLPLILFVLLIMLIKWIIDGF